MIHRLMVVAGVLLLSTMTGTPASASCAAPEIEVSPESGAPSSSIHVTGKYFADGCNDTGPASQAPAPPQKGIHVSLRQGDAEFELGVVDAGPDYTFTLDAEVPSDASPGDAQISAVASGHVAATASFTITGSSTAPPPKEQALPRTGRPIAPLVAGGVAAVGLGLAVTALSGRTRRASSA